MTEIRNSKRRMIHVVVIVILAPLTSCYDNSYDLFDRRSQFSMGPRSQGFESSERFYNRDRYETHNARPRSRYMTLSQGVADRRSRYPQRITPHGNGYDNLGNGDLTARFEDFRDRPRLSQDLRKRYETFVGNQRFYEGDFPEGGAVFRTRERIGSVPESWDRYRRPLNFGESRRDPTYGQRSNFDDNRRGPTYGQRLAVDEDFLSDESIRGADEEHTPIDIQPPVRRRPESVVGTSAIRPNPHRRNQPPFYRKDYFVTKPVGRKGFESVNADKNYESAAGEKENSGVSTVGTFVSKNEDNNQKRTDSAFQDSKDGAKLDIESHEKVGETTTIDKNGGNKSSVRSNRVTKKGHSTKGFATHHHKDETGNTTTFFDGSSEHGGQSDYQDLEDEFGTRRTMEVLNGKEDGRFFRESGGRTGNFGSGFLKDNKKTEKDILAKDDRYNNEEIYGGGKDHVDRGFKEASDYLGGGIWEDGRFV